MRIMQLPRPGRVPAGAWFLTIALISGVVGMCSLTDHIGWGGDSALYILHARNLAQELPYADTGFIYNPAYASLSPRVYPPGFPVLLAPLVRWRGIEPVTLKWVGVVSLSATLVVVGFLFLEFVPVGWAVCGASILGGNLYVRDLQNHILSDVPFLFWMLLALLLMARRRKSEGNVPSLVLGVAIGIVAYAAFATRTAGILLVLCMIAVDAWHRPPWRRSAVVPTGVFLALASAQAVLMEVVEVGYLDQLRLDPSTVFANAAGYAQWASSFWDNGGWEALRKGLFVISATLASIGFVRSMRNRVTELEVFCLAYLALILIWPSFQGFRFILPVLPFFVLYMLVGVRSVVASKIGGRFVALRWLGPLGILLVTSTYGAHYLRSTDEPRDDPIRSPDASQFFRFLREETPPNSVMVFVKPRILALFSGRRSLANHQPRDPEELESYFNSVGVTHVVVGPTELMSERRSYLVEFLESRASEYHEVHRTGRFHLYQRGAPPL